MSHVYRVPTLLAIMTVVGLVLALLAEGVWDVASWVLLLSPLVVLAARLRWRGARSHHDTRKDEYARRDE